MKLRPAVLEDLAEVQTWIPDEHSCLLWAGPGVRFPFDIQNLKNDISFSKENSYSLIDASGKLVGFGQIIKREGYMHLARIITCPSARGRGHGEKLCRMLMDLAKAKFKMYKFSLNVYSKNAPALALYFKLGFSPVNKPAGQAIISDNVFMILNDE